MDTSVETLLDLFNHGFDQFSWDGKDVDETGSGAAEAAAASELSVRHSQYRIAGACIHGHMSGEGCLPE